MTGIIDNLAHKERLKPPTRQELEALKLATLEQLNPKSKPIIQGTRSVGDLPPRAEAQALAASSKDLSLLLRNIIDEKPQGRLQRLIGQLPSMGGSDEPELAPELAQALAARPEDSGLFKKIITLPQENIIPKKPVLAGEQWEELRELLLRQQGNEKVNGIQPELAQALAARPEDSGLFKKIITLPQENIIPKKPVLAGEQWEELRELLLRQQGNEKVNGIQPELAQAPAAPPEGSELFKEIIENPLGLNKKNS